MITADQDIQYVLSPPNNHTCSSLAQHLEQVRHEVVSDFLRTKRVTARGLWHLVHGLIADGPEACLILDDSVQDNRSCRCIGLVTHQ